RERAARCAGAGQSAVPDRSRRPRARGRLSTLPRGLRWPWPAAPPASPDLEDSFMTSPGSTTGPTRREHDLLGDRDVPADAYYGVQTLRAQENFHITGVQLQHYPRMIEA